jgi:hypothetical protein
MRLITLCCVLLLVTVSFAAPTTVPSTPAQLAYENFKSLAGEWEGHSTKGWTERLVIRPIAGGSCVMETSQFAHGPDDDGMVTVYHMDGEHLMLTHYCMAKNQPRMRATEISEDGKSVVFTFLDGTNMASRDTGHMDKAVFHFDSPDAMRSQWTFYAKGKEQWMEEITYRRLSSAAPATQPAK